MCREAKTLQKRSPGSNSTNGFLASTRVLYPQCASLMIMFSSSQNFIQPQCLVVPQAGNGPVLHFRAVSGIQTGLTGVALELGVIFQPSFDNVKQSNSMELSCQNESRRFLQDKSPMHKDWLFKFQLKVSGACMCIHEYVYTSNSFYKVKWVSRIDVGLITRGVGNEARCPSRPSNQRCQSQAVMGVFFSKRTLLWKDLEVTWVDMRLFSTCFRSGRPQCHVSVSVFQANTGVMNMASTSGW